MLNKPLYGLLFSSENLGILFTAFSREKWRPD
jgi:hypothetical protein